MNDLILEVLYKNKLTCPECGHQQIAEMSSEENHRAYECDRCYEIVQSNENKCCIYCQYGDVKCTGEQIKWN